MFPDSFFGAKWPLILISCIPGTTASPESRETSSFRGFSASCLGASLPPCHPSFLRVPFHGVPDSLRPIKATCCLRGRRMTTFLCHARIAGVLRNGVGDCNRTFLSSATHVRTTVALVLLTQLSHVTRLLRVPWQASQMRWRRTRLRPLRFRRYYLYLSSITPRACSSTATLPRRHSSTGSLLT